MIDRATHRESEEASKQASNEASREASKEASDANKQTKKHANNHANQAKHSASKMALHSQSAKKVACFTAGTDCKYNIQASGVSDYAGVLTCAG